MDKPLITAARVSAITTLRPVDLKYLACRIEDFICDLPFLGCLVRLRSTGWNCLTQA